MMTLLIAFLRACLNFIYLFMKLLPTQNKITYISRQSKEISLDFAMVKEEINKRSPETKQVVLCHTLDDGIKATFINKIVYCFHILQQMYHIATSQVVILDSYCIPISLLKHKKSLKVIQMWHSMGTMKLFGYTALDKEEGSSSKVAKAMHMHENYDFVFASAPAYKSHLAAGFNCSIDKIVTMPLPRYDKLKSEEYSKQKQSEIYTHYPSLASKPVILYCPTFRKEERDFEEALEKLLSSIDTTKYNVVVKLHP